MQVKASFRNAICLWVLCAPMAMAPQAMAQATRNPAAAQVLFDEAQRLVDARAYAEACPKFKESYDLDPGGGTLLNLADCYEKAGSIALAWSTFKEALVAARRDGRDERVKYASQHINELEPRLTYLDVQVPAGARVPGLTVFVDGAPLGDAAWGVALPVDPGPHVVRAEAPGKQAHEQTLHISASPGAREVVEIPALAEAGAAGSPAPTGLSSAPVAMDVAPSSSQRTVGWIVGGAGVVSLGVGSYFGLRAFSRWDDRNAGCVGGCTEAAKVAGDEAKDAATLSTIGVGVGVLALGVATVLIVSAPDSEERPTASALSSMQVSLLTREGGGELSVRSNW